MAKSIKCPKVRRWLCVVFQEKPNQRVERENLDSLPLVHGRFPDYFYKNNFP
jgi:hypothetical protein